jgi:ribulose 1,5-bisphosphate synthetase/thiazole synthase
MNLGNGSLRVGDVSFWYQDIGLPDDIRSSLGGNRDIDVAIVGAGYSGLWSAYYLKKANPKLNIIVVEKEFSGHRTFTRGSMETDWMEW